MHHFCSKGTWLELELVIKAFKSRDEFRWTVILIMLFIISELHGKQIHYSATGSQELIFYIIVYKDRIGPYLLIL